MPHRFECPYLDGPVELTDEREARIRDLHELVLENEYLAIVGTLQDPDQVRRSRKDPAARLFVRWYDLANGKHCLVVVVEDSAPVNRFWIVTAFLTDQPRRGNLEWQRT
jgi:hypothetical protein